MLIITITAVVAAYAAYMAGGRVTAQTTAKHLNETTPEGPASHEHAVQAIAGGGCYWHCVTLYWYGIPYGTRCTYYCDAGGGPQ